MRACLYVGVHECASECLFWSVSGRVRMCECACVMYSVGSNIFTEDVNTISFSHFILPKMFYHLSYFFFQNEYSKLEVVHVWREKYKTC